MARISAVKVSLEGVSVVLRNLKRQKVVRARTMAKGMLKAGLHLQRKSQEVVPVDTGFLRASAFTTKTGTEFDADVRVGYTADYAIFVHEGAGRHKPGKIAKFLETPAREQRDEMLRIIAEESKL